MLHIALYEPEIPPNTGNIIRLCANMGAQLHLIEPLGFKVDNTKLKRAGLDYHDWTQIIIHRNYETFLNAMQSQRIFACSTKGETLYTQAQFQAEDVLLFGPETRGLPAAIRESFPKKQVLRLPMVANNRSLNLSNAAAIIAFEAWRQLDFIGA